jgi:hypothetical protein
VADGERRVDFPAFGYFRMRMAPDSDRDDFDRAGVVKTVEQDVFRQNMVLLFRAASISKDCLAAPRRPDITDRGIPERCRMCSHEPKGKVLDAKRVIWFSPRES